MRLVLTGPVIRRRLALCMAVFFALFTALAGRLFYLQVIAAEALQRRAQSQWTSESAIQPTRGRILDRNGAVLAQSATAYTASVSPRQVTDPARFAALLSPVLDMEAAAIEKRGLGHQQGRRHPAAPAAPGDGPAAQADEGGIRRRGGRRAERAVPGGGEQALLPHGPVRHPADRPDHHRRRGPGGAGAVAGPLPLRQGGPGAQRDRRQGPLPGLRRERVHRRGQRRQR